MIVDAIGTCLSSLTNWLMPNQLLADLCGHLARGEPACIGCWVRGFAGARHEGHRQTQPPNAFEPLGDRLCKAALFCLTSYFICTNTSKLLTVLFTLVYGTYSTPGATGHNAYLLCTVIQWTHVLSCCAVAKYAKCSLLSSSGLCSLSII